MFYMLRENHGGRKDVWLPLTFPGLCLLDSCQHFVAVGLAQHPTSYCRVASSWVAFQSWLGLSSLIASPTNGGSFSQINLVPEKQPLACHLKRTTLSLMAHCPQQGHTYEAHHQSPSKGLIQLILKSHYCSSLCRGCQVNHLETGLSFSHSSNNHWSPTWCQITLCVLSTCRWKKQHASFQRQGRRQTMRYKQIKAISDTNNDYRENLRGRQESGWEVCWVFV